MRPGVLAVGADRLERGALGKRYRGGQVQPAHMRGEHVARRKQPQRLTVVRVDRDRLLEQRLRDHAVLPRHAPVMRQRAHHQIPGVHAVRRLALRAEAFRRVELRLDRRHDVFGDLVLHGEHVGDLAIVALRPQVCAGRDVVELRRDAHAAAFLAHAAFDHVAHAELLGDLLHVHGLALVDEGRVARDDEEPAQLRERRDDVLADAVGEILLLGLAAEVREREHRDGRTVGQRQCGRRGAARIRTGRGFLAVGLLDGSDEAHALAGDGADQPLLLAGVVERAAGRIDAAREGRFRHDAAVPDRVEQIVARHHALAIAHQIVDEVEYLGLDGDQRVRPAQLAPTPDRARNPQTETAKFSPLKAIWRAVALFRAIIKTPSKQNQGALKAAGRRAR